MKEVKIFLRRLYTLMFLQVTSVCSRVIKYHIYFSLFACFKGTFSTKPLLFEEIYTFLMNTTLYMALVYLNYGMYIMLVVVFCP